MSRRTILALAFAVLLAAVALSTSAEVIDDFETTQATLTDAGSSVVTDNGTDVILGDHRELEIELVDGTSATVEAAVGSLSFDATAGGNSQGVATVVWDADTNTTVFDGDGLGGVDLTDNDETAFRIEVASASADTQLILEVFTNDGNSSKAGLRLPAVAATTDFFLSYADFVTNLGTGADFADVGAIVLRILGTNVAADIAHFETVGPTLTVTKIDIDPNDSMDFGTDPAVPGDTIRYQVQITNTGGLAQSVDLADTPDGNTSFVADSLSATPVAANDTYTAFGNVTKTVADGSGVLNNDADPDGGALFVRVSSSASASAAGGTVTWNDAGADDQGEGGFTYLPPAGFQGVDSFTYDLEDADGNTVTATVNVVLDRKVWFVDDDHGGGNLGTFADPFTDFTQLDDSANDVDRDGDIVFVYAHSGGNYSHTGLELEPGQQLIGEGEGLTLDGNVIVPAGAHALIHANDPDAPVAHGALLTMNNTIRGVTFGDTEGAAITGTNFGTLTVSNTTVTGAGGIVDAVTGTFDVVLNSASSSGGAGHAIDLDGVGGTFDAGSTSITGGVGGVRVEDAPSGASFDFGAAAVSGVSSGVDLGNSPMATFTFDSLDVTSTGTALNLANAGSMTLGGVTNTLETTVSGAAITAATTEMTGGWTFDNVTSDNSPTVGILLNSMTGGNFLVTGATDINAPMATGIEVSTGGARTYDFGSTDISGAGSVAGRGVNLISGNSMSSFVFDSLNVTTDNGAGVVTNDVGLLAIAGTTNSIVANNGNGLWLENTTVDEVPGGAVTGITFATLSSANSPLDGINLQSVTGSVTGSAGLITGAQDAAVRIGSATNNSGGAGNVTYAGSITNTQDFSVLVQERNGGAVTLSGDINDTGTGILVQNNNNGVANTITFSGSSKILNTGANTAVLLDNNDDAVVSFTGGGLDIDTSGAVTAFNAINGGTVQVTGAGNSVNTTAGTGVAVNIANTTIGASSVTFHSVDVDGASAGIVLDTTGNTGDFEVTGDGASSTSVTTAGRTTSAEGGGSLILGSGGTITNTTDGVRLTSATDVFLRNLVIGESTAAPGDAVSGTTVITDNGLEVSSVNNLVLDNVLISQTGDHGIEGFGSNVGLTLIHTEILNAGDNGAGATDGDDAMDFNTGSGAPLTGTVLIQSSILADMSDTGLEVENFSGDLDLTVTDSFIGNNDHSDGNCNPCEGDGFLLRADGGSATIDMVVRDTTFNDIANDGIDLGNDQANNVSTLIAENLAGTNNDGADNLIDTANTNGTLRVRITDLSSDGAHRGTVLFFKADGAATTDVTIEDSLIQGSAIGAGIQVFVDGDPGTGVLANGNARVLIENTDISNHFSEGVSLIVQDMDTASGTLDATLNDVTTQKPFRGDDAIVGSLDFVAGGGGDGTLQFELINSSIGEGSDFFGSATEGLVLRGDRQIDVACVDDGVGGNGMPCTNIGNLTSDDTLIASIMNENGNQVAGGSFADTDVFTSAALRNNSGEVLIISPAAVTDPALP